MNTTADNALLVELPIGSIYPDPVQPRLHPDAELANSLRSVGQLQPIRVEPAQPIDAIDVASGKTFVQIAAESGYMIQDGERRYRGLLAAGKRSVLAVIVPPATEGQRLLRQLIANTGAPLTPMEEARAYKRLMELEGWSANRLAKELGKPRSTVGDRVRALELDPVWIALMDAGVLQLSHAPILHRYAAVPHDAQDQAAAFIREEFESPLSDKRDGPLSIEDLEEVVYDSFREALVPLEDVPGYDGPVVEVAPYAGVAKRKYAADPSLWRPIVERAPKKKSRASSSPSYLAPRPTWEKGLPAGVRTRKAKGYPEPADGEVPVLGHGWEFYGQHGQPFDPRVLLERAAPESLVKVAGNYSTRLMTTDLDAMQAARDAFTTRLETVYAERAAAARDALQRAFSASPVHGAGCVGLAEWALRTAGGGFRSGVDPFDVIQILGLSDVGAVDPDELWDAGDEEQVEQVDVVARVVADMQARGTLTTFCSALAAIPTLDVEVPRSVEVRRDIINEYERVAPTWPGAASGKKASKPKPRAKQRAAAADVAVTMVVATDTLSCIHCGCTDDDPCPGGCAWVTTDPPVCTTCFDVDAPGADTMSAAAP